MMEGHLRTMRRERTRPATVLGARARAERLWNEAVARPCAPADGDCGPNAAHLPLSPSPQRAEGGRGGAARAPSPSPGSGEKEKDVAACSPSPPLGEERAGVRRGAAISTAPGQPEEGAAERPSLPSGPATGKLRALWNSAYDLGLIHDRSDAALDAWLRRLTGLDDDACIEAADLDRGIQALKAWLARVGGVDWRPHVSLGQDGRVRETRRPRARVLEAQWRLLHRQGRVRIGSDAALGAYAVRLAGLGRADSHLALSNAQADALIRHFGKCIRAASERHD